MDKKEIATSFLNLVGCGDVQKGFEQYVSPRFIHHNQFFEGSREALLNAMEEAHKTVPNKSIEIKSCYAEGDTVITHSLVVKEEAGLEIAVVHIFRFEKDKIVELWDLGQVIDENSPNKNGLF